MAAKREAEEAKKRNAGDRMLAAIPAVADGRLSDARRLLGASEPEPETAHLDDLYPDLCRQILEVVRSGYKSEQKLFLAVRTTKAMTTSGLRITDGQLKALRAVRDDQPISDVMRGLLLTLRLVVEGNKPNSIALTAAGLAAITRPN